MRTTVLSGYQSDFAVSLRRAGRTMKDLVREIVTETLAAARVDPEQVDSVHVGNAFGQLYTGQGHLGAMPATVVPELWGKPAMRHEAACASGSVATLAAMAEIEAGRYDCVLVIGAEQEKTMPGFEAAQVQAAAALVPDETEGGGLIWPRVFDAIADEYDRRYGIDEQHLRAIGALNLTNAKNNPKAQTRSWALEAKHFAADDEHNPIVTGRLRRNDCCQITDGGAGVLLVSDRWLERHRRGGEGATIAGWGHRTVGLALAPKLARSREHLYVMPHVREAITDAWERARIDGVTNIDGIETHDCMTPNEYLAIDHFGITAPGESWKAVEDGTLERDGSVPINASGGLMGVGHPVGATGIRMLVDCLRQVTGSAGDTQIADAQRMATLNIVGSTATTVSFIVESPTARA